MGAISLAKIRTTRVIYATEAYRKVTIMYNHKNLSETFEVYLMIEKVVLSYPPLCLERLDIKYSYVHVKLKLVTIPTD